LELVRQGRLIPDVAASLGVSPQSLRNWMRQDERDRGERDDGLISAEREDWERECQRGCVGMIEQRLSSTRRPTRPMTRCDSHPKPQSKARVPDVEKRNSPRRPAPCGRDGGREVALWNDAAITSDHEAHSLSGRLPGLGLRRRPARQGTPRG
ncbi:MAG: hypothetical protein QOJ29_3496, partial [Thermoleophilaceae bacterium]|nr:hypothetical protein [Thermoleophilaceae bacterium]